MLRRLNAMFEAAEDGIAAWWKTSYLRFPFSFRRYAKEVALKEGMLHMWHVRKEAFRLMLSVRRERIAQRRRKLGDESETEGVHL